MPSNRQQDRVIGFYRWNETDPATKDRILNRSRADIGAASEKVRPVIADVRERGDAALFDCARRFDRAELSSLKVSDAEFESAARSLSPDVRAAIDHCARNVRRFHEGQMRRVEKEWWMEVEPGVFAGEKVTPITSAGLYVPGGKNLYPSAMYMLCIPAVMAGVGQIAVATPARADGTIGDALLYAASVSGVRNVFKVGGAQAIAAFAFGTQTVPAVKKVLGPGSPYVAAAKQILSSHIDPGMPAGPSESIILCDGTANPHNTLLDILNEAEHGPDSAALLVTHDEALALYVRDHLPAAMDALPEPQREYCRAVMAGYGGVILTRSLAESIDFCNAYATEHLMVKVADPDLVLPLLHNAGEILVGETTPSSLGNYGIGVNHVLPTAGMAHTYSCTSVWDFLKRTSLARVTAQGFESLSPSVAALADYEGFPAHGNVLRQRKTQKI